ncbi:DUF6543 domain-containing protein [Pseudomonas sp. Irchel 3F5]|uniref:DUF6543 domain-containing protein n=1 Tax=Pseudomonas sp. Irchel 3F5 TaxID=2009002 RepID=UPI000BA2C5DD|nr:DUF6543 domain-containing protein [Pseudomonas sp. Irchel 3F5]
MNTSLGSYQHAVSLAFASRPTLRETIHKALAQIVADQYPQVDASYPELRTAPELYLWLREAQAPNNWTAQPLAEVFLEKLVSHTSFDFTGLPMSDCFLSLSSIPRRIYDRDPVSGLSQLMDLTLVTDAFNQLLSNFHPYLQQAQLDYWNQAANQGATRLQGFCQILKAALASDVEVQGLDEDQRDCLYAMLSATTGVARGDATRVPRVFIVDVTVASSGQTYQQLLPYLLVTRTLLGKTVVLLCNPSGHIDAFDSLESMAKGVRDSLARRFRFDSFSWDRYQITDDVFAVQGAVVLNGMLESLVPVSERRFATVPDLELGYAALTDPSNALSSQPVWRSAPRPVDVTLPQWLADASLADRLEYRARLLDLQIAQARSKGKSSMDDLLDLRAYTRKALLDLMRLDHLADANYDADDLILEFWVARGVPGTSSGAVEIQRISLTEFAIGNLSSVHQGELKYITHKTDQQIWSWLTEAYLKALVQRADIGRTYPDYVSKKLLDPGSKAERVERFGAEFASQLPLIALKAKIDGDLTQAGYQRVLGFFQGSANTEQAQSLLAPLAFKREADASEVDLVTNMFVFLPGQASGVVVLFRPFEASKPLQEFASQTALHSAVVNDDSLNASILSWMSSEAQTVYGNGGFKEPHLPRPILDTQTWPTPVSPVHLDLQSWRSGIDAHLYMTHTQMLVDLAKRDTVSNAQSRWAILVEGGSLMVNLLFGLAAPFLRGPAAVLAWLLQGAQTLNSDLRALANGNQFEKSQAVVDLLLNLAMVLLHGSLQNAQVPAKTQGQLPVYGPPRRMLPVSANVAVKEGKVYLPNELSQKSEFTLDFAWYGAQGLNRLGASQRQALAAMRSNVSLVGIVPLRQGAFRGLYQVAEEYYTLLDNHAFKVRADAEGIRVVDPSGGQGPRLQAVNGQWHLAGLQLAGGAPKSQVELLKKANKKKLVAMQHEIDGINAQYNDFALQMRSRWGDLETQNKALERLTQLRDGFVERQEISADPEPLTALILQTSEKIATQTTATDAARQAVIAGLEESIARDEAVEKLYMRMSAPEFFRIRAESSQIESTFKTQRGIVRRNLIFNLSKLNEQLFDSVDFNELAERAKHIKKLPITNDEVVQYQRYRTALARSVDVQEQMVRRREQLDTLLIDTWGNNNIAFELRDNTVQYIFEIRTTSTLKMRIGYIEDLAELALERTGGADEETLESFKGYLSNKDISSASSTHNELTIGTFTLTETIDGFQTAQAEYANALTMVDYLERFGGVAVNQATLSRYKVELGLVKTQAEHKLAAAIKESEWASAPLFKPLPYKARPGTRRVVRTGDGKTLIGEQSELDGEEVVRQHDPVSNAVLSTYHQHGDRWVEVVEAKPEARPLSVTSSQLIAARQSARQLTTEIEPVLTLARRYIASNEPRNLAFVIERHIEKLQSASSTLERSAATLPLADSQLIETIEEGILRLTNVKRDLLVNLHLTTSRPTAESLAYLYQERKITINRSLERRKLGDNDYLDIYQVRGVQGTGKEDGLWEVHLHYRAANDDRRQFQKGHIKIWSERKLGREAQLHAALTEQRFLEIYRGDVQLAQVARVLPFD